MAKYRDKIRRFELVVIFDPNLDEAAIAAEAEKIKAVAEANSGQLISTDTWGKRHLAYPIERRQTGIYVIFIVEGDNNFIQMLERQLKINDAVLRQLAVVKDKFAPDLSAKVREQSIPVGESARRSERSDDNADTGEVEEAAPIEGEVEAGDSTETTSPAA